MVMGFTCIKNIVPRLLQKMFHIVSAAKSERISSSTRSVTRAVTITIRFSTSREEPRRGVVVRISFGNPRVRSLSAP